MRGYRQTFIRYKMAVFNGRTSGQTAIEMMDVRRVDRGRTAVKENKVYGYMFRKDTTNNEETWRKKVNKNGREEVKKGGGKHKNRSCERRLAYVYKPLDVHVSAGTIHQPVMSDIRFISLDGIGLSQAICSAMLKHKCLTESLVKSDSEMVKSVSQNTIWQEKFHRYTQWLLRCVISGLTSCRLV